MRLLVVVVVLELKVVEVLSNEKWAQSPQRAGLIAEEAPTKVPVEYADFAFSPDLASKLPEHTGINDYADELVDVNGFIRPPSYPQALPSFSTKSRTDSFGCVLIIGASITS